jgi:hypothetical protein
MSNNPKTTEPSFLTKNIYINEFNDVSTTSNLFNSDLYQLMKKLDNISDYLNILMVEINEIKKYTKINTYQPTQPVLLPSHQNKLEVPFYQDQNSHYGLNPDIVFK